MTQPLDFPFWQTLSREAQQALQIAQRMKETGESIGGASKWLTGRTWDGARLARGLTTVTKTMTELGVRHAATEALVAGGMQAAGATAATAAGGGLLGLLGTVGGWFGLTGTAAVVVGGLLVTAALGGITYGAATWAGSQMADEPVQPGTRSEQTGGQPPAPAGVISAGSDEPYGVFLAGGSFGGDVLVGQKSAIEAYRSCDLRGWGLDCSKTVSQVATLRDILGGSFATGAEALNAYCADLVPGSERYPPLQPYVVLMKLASDGSEHNVVNAPACA